MLGKTPALLCVATLMLAGCATHKEMLVTGASRADGTITLSYESNEFQRVSVDGEKAESMAAQRCKAWGYSGAESFGSQETQCLSRRGLATAVAAVYRLSINALARQGKVDQSEDASPIVGRIPTCACLLCFGGRQQDGLLAIAERCERRCPVLGRSKLRHGGGSRFAQ